MKFNFLKKSTNLIKNFEQAPAYKMSAEQELYAAVVTTTLNDSFYEKDKERLDRIQNLISKSNPEFVAKLAVYARNEMYMRTVPLVLAVELAKQNSGNSLVSKTINGVVQRADEITELLAFYQLANNRNESIN